MTDIEINTYRPLVKSIADKAYAEKKGIAFHGSLLHKARLLTAEAMATRAGELVQTYYDNPISQQLHLSKSRVWLAALYVASVEQNERLNQKKLCAAAYPDIRCSVATLGVYCASVAMLCGIQMGNYQRMRA